MKTKGIIAVLVLVLAVGGAVFFLMKKPDAQTAKLAEEQYAQAIVLWEQGKHQNAYEAFDAVVKQYPQTPAADSALMMRNKLDEQYRSLYNDAVNAARNDHHFAKGVWQSILAYRQAHNSKNPNSLDELSIAQSGRFTEFLAFCRYEIAARDKGIFLDCTAANAPYMMHVADTGQDAEFAEEIQ